jgi:hypothetical protein
MHVNTLVARASGEEPGPFWEGWSRLQREYDRLLPACCRRVHATRIATNNKQEVRHE